VSGKKKMGEWRLKVCCEWSVAGDGGQRKRVARSNLPAAPTVRSIAAAAWGRIASGVGRGMSDDGRVRLCVRSEVERLRSERAAREEEESRGTSKLRIAARHKKSGCPIT
jgi:hypothetical protein